MSGCRSSSRARSPMPAAGRCQGRPWVPSGTPSAMRGRCSWASTAPWAAGSCGRTSRSSPRSPTRSSRRIPTRGCPTRSGATTSSPTRPPRCSGEMIADGHVNLVGGCCGTTPDHIRELARVAAAGRPRAIPAVPRKTRLAGLEPLDIDAASLFVNVGERTNVTGSRKFARLVLAGEYPEAVAIARQQVENGAQMIDINMDEALLDSEAAMARFLDLIAVGAGHLARPGRHRLQPVVGHRGRASARAGTVGGQLGQPQGGRGGVPAPGDARPLVRRRGHRDGVRRAGPGGDRGAARGASRTGPTVCSPSRWASRPRTSSSTPTSSPSAPASRSTRSTRSSTSRRRGASRRSCPARSSAVACRT